MDKIDEALALSSFSAVHGAIKAMVQAAGEDWPSVLDDPRVEAWIRANKAAMLELIHMNLEAAINNTIAAQISTPPVTPEGNRRRN